MEINYYYLMIMRIKKKKIIKNKLFLILIKIEMIPFLNLKMKTSIG